MTLGAVLISAPYGVEAIAWAMLVTSFISFFINAYYPGKLFGFGALSQLRVAWKLVLSVTVMFLAITFIENVNPLEELLYKLVLGAFTYFGMVAVLKFDIFENYIKPRINQYFS